MIGRIGWALLLAGGVAATGCAKLAASREAAQAKVAEFHDLLDQERFDDIYAGASDDLRASTSREQMVALLEAIHRKLGKVTASATQGWNVKSHNLRTTVTLSQETTFERGKGTETFSFAIRDGAPVLIGYNISSTDLIVR